MKKIFLFFVVALLVGCTDYTDDFNAIDERLDKLEQALPSIEEQIESINTQLISLKETDNAIKAQIAELEKSDKATATEIANLKSKDSELEKSISDLQKYVDTQIKNAKSEAAAAYATIEQYNTIVAQLSALQASTNKLGKDLTAKINAEVKKLNDKITDLENRLKAVEEKVENLLARIQSVSYIPEYADGKVLIERMGSTSWGTLSFRISPKDAVAELAKVWESAVSCEAYYPKTRAVSFVKLAVTEFVGDAENGVVTVKVSGEGLSDEFFAGTQEAKIALVISDGNNQVVSEYTDAYGREITDEIWYTTTEGNVLEPRNAGVEIFGANIVSNTYENGKGVIKFDGPVTKVGDSSFYNRNLTQTIILPNSVTEIGVSAFHSNDGLISIDMGLKVETIGDNCFRTCKLAELILSPSLKTIGASFIEFSSVISEITIPDSVESIADGAFRHTSNIKFHGKFASEDGKMLIVNNRLIAISNDANMTEFVVPSTVTSVGESVLCNAGNDNNISSFSGNCATEDGIFLISDGVLCAIAGGSGVTDLIIPNGVTYISPSITYMYNKIESIVIPDSVTEIGYSAFAYSNKVTTITIGSGIKNIGSGAFRQCSKLSTIYCKAIVPPMLQNNLCLEKVNANQSYTIYVPQESVEAYKKAEYWKKYANEIVGFDF